MKDYHLIKERVDKMLILEDTRQQEEKHENKHKYFMEHDIHWNRTALYCGDYTLPWNQSVCIDTKKDIQELIGDIQVKQMSKGDIKKKVYELCEQRHISFDLSDSIYHAICDDDTDRFAEKEINDICFQNGVQERTIAEFQRLYVKRHGFFHRGLKRAQNSGIKLFVLTENVDGIKSIDDVFHWQNPRKSIWTTDKSQIVGYYKNGRVRFGRKQKYPHAMSGEILAKAMLTMEHRYGVKFCFCRPEESGEKIVELLGG